MLWFNSRLFDENVSCILKCGVSFYLLFLFQDTKLIWVGISAYTITNTHLRDRFFLHVLNKHFLPTKTRSKSRKIYFSASLFASIESVHFHHSLDIQIAVPFLITAGGKGNRMIIKDVIENVFNVDQWRRFALFDCKILSVVLLLTVAPSEWTITDEFNSEIYFSSHSFGGPNRKIDGLLSRCLLFAFATQIYKINHNLWSNARLHSSSTKVELASTELTATNFPRLN